jgi:hypothetical protein
MPHNYYIYELTCSKSILEKMKKIFIKIIIILFGVLLTSFNNNNVVITRHTYQSYYMSISKYDNNLCSWYNWSDWFPTDHIIFYDGDCDFIYLDTHILETSSMFKPKKYERYLINDTITSVDFYCLDDNQSEVFIKFLFYRSKKVQILMLYPNNLRISYVCLLDDKKNNKTK